MSGTSPGLWPSPPIAPHSPAKPRSRADAADLFCGAPGPCDDSLRSAFEHDHAFLDRNSEVGR